jgi:hypothetical protein
VTEILARLVDELSVLDEQLRAGGRAHLDGDPHGALALLDDVAVLLADVRADLRRELADPEPGRAA